MKPSKFNWLSRQVRQFPCPCVRPTSCSHEQIATDFYLNIQTRHKAARSNLVQHRPHLNGSRCDPWMEPIFEKRAIDVTHLDMNRNQTLAAAKDGTLKTTVCAICHSRKVRSFHQKGVRMRQWSNRRHNNDNVEECPSGIYCINSSHKYNVRHWPVPTRPCRSWDQRCRPTHLSAMCSSFSARIVCASKSSQLMTLNRSSIQ